MRRVKAPERRARLGRRHHLATEALATDVTEVARDLVALHSTDPATVYLSAAARLEAPSVPAIERALYEERTLVRLLAMRRTVFVVPVELAPVVQAACARALQAGERRKLVHLLEEAGVADEAGAWLRDVEDTTVAALAARGEAYASELAADVPGLRGELHFGAGRKWEGVQRISSRVLFLLATEGRIVRGRPRGSWVSSQYRWAPVESWLGRGLPDLPEDEARVALARRWLSSFGPGTAADLRWWTGWTMGQTRAALRALRPVEVDVGDGPARVPAPGFLLEDDVDPVPGPEPWAALLPALDPTVMGWTDRNWFLGDHGPALFDRSGNAGPTVWWDGRIVGGWAQRKSGEITLRILEDIGTAGRYAVDAAAQRLRTWLGDARVTPRFGTPLVKELTA